MTAPDRPVLRYMGAKWKLAPWILRHLPWPHDAYVEPFGGSAAVLLRKDPSPLEVWNDLGEEVYNFFRALRDEELCARLVRALEFTPWHRLEFEECYAGLGGPEDDPVERARRFFVTSWQGIRGNHTARPAWRYVKTGSNFAKVPPETWAFDHLYAASARLRRVQFEHRDAFEVIRDYDAPETLFYVDPPYLFGLRSRWGSQYEVDTATEEWHKELLDLLLGVRGMVVLSGYPSELYREALEARGWLRVETLARGNALRRGDRVEALWISPRAQERLGRLL